VNSYTRHDVLRILALRERQLLGWERGGLFPSKASYTFRDLSQLRTLKQLRASRISVASIKESLGAIQSVSGMANPLLEAGLEAGSGLSHARVVFRHSGAVMEPIARQFLLDFSGRSEGGQTLALVARPANLLTHQLEVTQLFLGAVRAEERGQTQEAIAGYESILAIDRTHAPACINLGTLYYNRGEFLKAEQLYRMATEADPEYALAFFDHGNVLDELRRLPEAIAAYKRAVALMPSYADALYNLALAYERNGDRRKALEHWTRYLKLDASGPWAKHARSQVKKILSREQLAIVHRGAASLSRPGPATLRGQGAPEADLRIV
jgi:tetratricopeptide (TPR) repeat protein